MHEARARVCQDSLLAWLRARARHCGYPRRRDCALGEGRPMTRIIRYLGSGNGAVERPGIGVECDDGTVRPLPVSSLAELLAAPLAEVRAIVDSATSAAAPLPQGRVRMLAPVDGLTEVWASGVTYRRSRQARIEESGDGDVYARVYDAVRPELFFKSLPWRAVGDGDPIGV